MTTLSICNDLTVMMTESPLWNDQHFQFPWHMAAVGDVSNNEFTLLSLDYTSPQGSASFNDLQWTWGQWDLVGPRQVQLDSEGHAYLEFYPIIAGTLTVDQTPIPVSMTPKLEIGCPPVYPQCGTYFILGHYSGGFSSGQVELAIAPSRDYAGAVPELSGMLALGIMLLLGAALRLGR